MKTIHIEALDRNSVDGAIQELKTVRAEWNRKANLLCETVAAMLEEQIQANIDAIPYSDDLIDVKTHQAKPEKALFAVYSSGNKVVVEDLSAKAEVAFIEFGAGISHNSNGQQNPLAENVSFDTGIGSYGNGNGLKPYWFVAHNLISRGTPAYMPIYRAIEAIKPQIPTIARQIFV